MLDIIHVSYHSLDPKNLNVNTGSVTEKCVIDSEVSSEMTVYRTVPTPQSRRALEVLRAAPASRRMHT